MCDVTFENFQHSHVKEQNNFTAFTEVKEKDLVTANYSHFYYQLDDVFILLSWKGKVPIKVASSEKWKLKTFNFPSYGDTPKCHVYQRIILSKWVLNLTFSGSIWSLQCQNYFKFYDAKSVQSKTMLDGWLCNRKFGVFSSLILKFAA